MLFQLNQRQQFVNRLLYVFAPALPDSQSVTNVFLDCHLRKERVRLKDDADAAFARGQLGHVLSVQHDFSRVWLFEARNDPQNCRLPTTRGAEQNESLAFGHVKSNIFEHARLAKAFADTRDAGRRLGRAHVWSGIYNFLHDSSWLCLHNITLIYVEPIARKKEHTENQKRKKREHNCNGVGCFDLSFIKLGEDIERGGLRSSRKIS